jgi:hypothetical protein
MVFSCPVWGGARLREPLNSSEMFWFFSFRETEFEIAIPMAIG